MVYYFSLLDTFNVLIYKYLSHFSLTLPGFLAWIVTASVLKIPLIYLAHVEPINIAHKHYSNAHLKY